MADSTEALEDKMPGLSQTDCMAGKGSDSKTKVYRSSDRRNKTCAGRVRINVKRKTDGQKDGQTDRGPLLYFSCGLYT